MTLNMMLIISFSQCVTTNIVKENVKTRLNFYKAMAVPVLLHDSETWVPVGKTNLQNESIGDKILEISKN